MITLKLTKEELDLLQLSLVAHISILSLDNTRDQSKIQQVKAMEAKLKAIAEDYRNTENAEDTDEGGHNKLAEIYFRDLKEYYDQEVENNLEIITFCRALSKINIMAMDLLYEEIPENNIEDFIDRIGELEDALEEAQDFISNQSDEYREMDKVLDKVLASPMAQKLNNRMP